MDGRTQRAVRYAVEVLLGLFLLVVLLWALRGFGVPWVPPSRAEAQTRSSGNTDAVSATLRAVFQHDYGVLAVAWSPDSKRLATGGPLSRTVTVWDVERRAAVWRIDSFGTADYLAWSPDGRHVAVAGFVPTRAESGARLLDAARGAIVRHLDRPSGGQGKATALAWSPDGRWLAVSYYGLKHVAVYEAATSRVARTIDLHGEPADALAYSPDGRLLAIGVRAPGAGWPVSVVETQDGAQVRALAPHHIHAHAVAWSRDGRRVVVQHYGGRISVYGWPAGTLEHRIELEQGSSPTPAFFPDGRHIVSGGRDVAVWRVDSWLRVASIAHVVRPLSVISLAPDGRQFATGGNVRVAVWAIIR